MRRCARVVEVVRSAVRPAMTGFALAGALPTSGDAQQAPSAAAPAVPPLVFEGATVVDVERGEVIPNQRVVIVGNRIVAMSGADASVSPPGATVIDARGKYLIPGLWDMHVHLKGDESGPLYHQFIPYGVTGIREMGQRGLLTSDSFRVWQRNIMTGLQVGPRTIGPSADFSDVFMRRPSNTQTPEEARRIVDSLKAAGNVFLKYHGTPDDPAIIFAVLSEARKVGMPVTGHVPSSVSIEEVVDSGMRGIEHVSPFWHSCFSLFSPWPPGPHDLNAKQFARITPVPEQALTDCAALLPKLVRHGTWVTPTIIVEANVRPRQVPGIRAMVYLLSRFGMTNFLVGTDYAPKEKKMRPGLSVWEEMDLLVNAGLEPSAVLQAATLNPARYLGGTDSLGTVAPGKLADLVLLDADPLVDIRNVRQILAVVANGRYFDRAALDSLLAAAPGSTP